MKKYPKLSASGSQRWILCSGSRKAEEGLPDVKSKYAEEGTLAHEIAAALLNKEDISNYDITDEMLENVELYVEYVEKLIDRTIYYPQIYIEQKSDFSHIVPYNTGTADAIIISVNTLHIIDFKYGVGHPVSAYENTQLLLYAMGIYNGLKNKDIIKEIVLHIVQPRINNYDKWSLSIAQLFWWEGYIKAKAEIALDDNAPRTPSENACKWCKAKTTCYALYDFTADVIESSDKKIGDDKIKTILDNSKMVKNYLNSLEVEVFERLSAGETFKGYKLIEGRNIRKIKSENENKLFELLGEKAYSKSLIKVTDLEKIVDKETLSSFIHISKSKPLLVVENDKRKALEIEKFDFESVEDDYLS